MTRPIVIGHVGARGGSKGVPNKNKRPFADSNLVSIALNQLADSNVCDHIVVSTDDPEIYELGIEFNSIDIGLRPPELAGDKAAKLSAWVWCGSCVQESFADEELVFIDLDCTSPLREVQDIVGAFKAFLDGNADILISVSEARKNPYFNMIEFDEDSLKYRVSKKLEPPVVARQNAPKVYEHGSIYIFHPSRLNVHLSLLDHDIDIFEIPWLRSLDIDTEQDFSLVESLYVNR